jgi:ribonuclease-3
MPGTAAAGPAAAHESAESVRARERLTARLGPGVVDPDLLRLALCHRSYCAEMPGQESNERLEFLGDAVLGVVVTEELYRRQPELPEGDLARIRAAVVSTEALAPIGASLGLGAALLLGRGEDASGGRDKPSILADALEAVIGALFLSGGMAQASTFVLGLIADELAEVSRQDELGDAKNRLQEMCSRLGAEPPRYVVTEQGPEHAKRFDAEVRVGTEVVGRGRGSSKKQAERAAAEDAIVALQAGGRDRPRA